MKNPEMWCRIFYTFLRDYEVYIQFIAEFNLQNSEYYDTYVNNKILSGKIMGLITEAFDFYSCTVLEPEEWIDINIEWQKQCNKIINNIKNLSL